METVCQQEIRHSSKKVLPSLIKKEIYGGRWALLALNKRSSYKIWLNHSRKTSRCYTLEESPFKGVTRPFLSQLSYKWSNLFMRINFSWLMWKKYLAWLRRFSMRMSSTSTSSLKYLCSSSTIAASSKKNPFSMYRASSTPLSKTFRRKRQAYSFLLRAYPIPLLCPLITS